MIAEPLRLDPQFEELLREAARDPESSFLRVPRPKLVPVLLESPEPLSANSTGMTLVERELVRVYRHELAWLLKQACGYKLIESPNSRWSVSRFGTRAEPAHPLRPDELRARLTHQEPAGGDFDREQAIVLITNFLAGPLAEAPTVPDLAAAAWRLQPREDARLWAAQGMVVDGSPLSGAQIASDALQNITERHLRVSASTIIGHAFSRLGLTSRSHTAYATSTDADGSCVLAWLWRMLLAIHLRDSDDVQRCSSAIESLAGGQREPAAWFRESIRYRRAAGDIQVSPEVNSFLRTIEGRLGSTARRICHDLT